MTDGSSFDMIKQARDLQKRMGLIQKKVERAELTATAGGGMVTATITGKLMVKKVEIEPQLFADGDRRMIEDLVASAINAAIEKAQRMMAKEMREVTGGLSIPGL
ncbi:MAG: YbaB/EbfC family nucleoid-associated protein [Deltaproteobacteria bacterium]